MRVSIRAVRWVLCASTIFQATVAMAQTGENVLLVINDASPASIQIGEYYARKRAITQDHIVRVKTVTTDTIERPEYLRSIEAPLASWITNKALQDKVLYIVLTKGVPLRIAGTAGRQGTMASVDSELTLLYRSLVGISSTVTDHLPNPYFLGDRPLSDAKPFTRFSSDIYLVTRLDGFTVDDVLKLVDRGASPASDGKFVLDQKATVLDRGGDLWLQQAALRLREAGLGDRVTFDDTRAVASASGPVIGYYSWGSNDPTNQLRRFGFQFANGAIAGMFVSTDGRTFAEPPATWKPSGPNGGPQFAGSFQSLAGDLIREGVTGVSAHVAEPYLDATIRPQILFPAYVSGRNLGESFYLALPYLSWQTVVIGDPLCAPFSRQALSQDQLYKAIDAETELPGLFSERRLALLSRGGLSPEAWKLLVKADVQTARGDHSAAEQSLLKALQVEPRLTAAGFRLAARYEETREYAKAIERYRAILKVEPENLVALNNLAYGLAERQHAPKEALPFAEKAYRLRSTPEIADTLGWIHHLLGDDSSALPLIERAVASAGRDVEVLIHAATVHTAIGNRTRAKAELDAAEKINPSIADRPEVKALRAKIQSN